MACSSALPVSQENAATYQNSNLTGTPVSAVPVDITNPANNSKSAISTQGASTTPKKPPGKSNADKNSSNSSTASSSEEKEVVEKKEKELVERKEKEELKLMKEKDAEIAAEREKHVTPLANSTSSVPNPAIVPANQSVAVPSPVNNSIAVSPIASPVIAPTVSIPTISAPISDAPVTNSTVVPTLAPSDTLTTSIDHPLSASVSPTTPTIPSVTPAASQETQQQVPETTQNNYTAGFNKGLELDFYEYFKVLDSLSSEPITPTSPIIAIVKVPPGNSVKPLIEGFIPLPFPEIDPSNVADIVPLTPINEPIQWQQSTRTYNLIPKNDAATVLHPKKSDNGSTANVAINNNASLSSNQPGAIIKQFLEHQLNLSPKQNQNNQFLTDLLAPKPKTNSFLNDVLSPPKPSISDIVNVLLDLPPKQKSTFGQSNNLLDNIFNGSPQSLIDKLLLPKPQNLMSEFSQVVANVLEPLVFAPKKLTLPEAIANFIVGPPPGKQSNLFGDIDQILAPPKPSLPSVIADLLTQKNPLADLLPHESPLGHSPVLNEALQLLAPDVMQPSAAGETDGLPKINADTQQVKLNANIMDSVLEPPIIESPYIPHRLGTGRPSISNEVLDMMTPNIQQPNDNKLLNRLEPPVIQSPYIPSARHSIPLEVLDMMAPKVLQPSRLVQDPLAIQPPSNTKPSQWFDLKIETLPNIINPLNILHSQNMHLKSILNGEEPVSQEQQRLVILATIQKYINHVIKRDMFIQNALIANRPVGLMLIGANQQMQPLMLIPDLTL